MDNWSEVLVPAIANTVISPLTLELHLYALSAIALISATIVYYNIKNPLILNCFNSLLTAETSLGLVQLLRTTSPTLWTQLLYVSLLLMASVALAHVSGGVSLFLGPVRSAIVFSSATLIAAGAVAHVRGLRFSRELLSNEQLIPVALEQHVAFKVLWRLLAVATFALALALIRRQEVLYEVFMAVFARSVALFIVPSLWPLAVKGPSAYELALVRKGRVDSAMVVLVALAVATKPEPIPDVISRTGELARVASTFLHSIAQTTIALHSYSSDWVLSLPLLLALYVFFRGAERLTPKVTVVTGILRSFLVTQTALLVLRRVPSVLALAFLALVSNLQLG
jgi:hypothetical protein